VRVADPVPLLDLKAEVEELWSELEPAVRGVLRSGRFVLGPEVEAFERELAELVGARHAVGLNSGSDALAIGLRALGVGRGHEVITTAFSFAATAGAIALAGAEPVFVDVDPATFNLDPAGLEAARTARTRAVLPVHLFGQPADVDPIAEFARRHGLALLCDAAQAIGAEYAGRPVGTLGDASTFSMYPSKNLGAYGDAGALVTDDPDLAARARSLRNHGETKRYISEELGYNSRLDEIQAAILRVKLPRLERWNAARRSAAARYAKGLAALPGVQAPLEAAGRSHVWHQYTIRLPSERRDGIAARLAERQIATGVYYPEPLHRMAPFRRPATLPQTERACAEVLSLPIGPYLREAQQDRVVSALAEALGDATTAS
jgi:dTDP-4-amino-4,6-dideoxygalactose transaminase